MMRRRHKKSRRGCLECKRRHIKCDETHPNCINCTTAERDCSYQTHSSNDGTSTPGHSPSGDSRISVSASPPMLGFMASAAPQLPGLIYGEQIPQFNLDSTPISHMQEVNMIHMELFHHFMTDNSLTGCCYPEIRESGRTGDMLRRASVRHALSEPYLMYQVLALAARHLCFLRPESAVFWQSQALRLQSHALALFNNLDVALHFQRGIDTTNNLVSAFLFSSLLGMQSLCDVLSHRDHVNDFPSVLARLLAHFRLHRGVIRVLDGHRAELAESIEIGPILELQSRHHQQQQHLFGGTVGGYGGGHECDDIRRRVLLVPDLSHDALDATLKAVDLLQWAIDGGESCDSSSRAHVLLSWPVMVGSGYVDLLEAGRPEALAVLGYYFLALHYCRDVWMFCGSGHYLITSLSNYLGRGRGSDNSWADWIATPCRLLRESLDREEAEESRHNSLVDLSEADLFLAAEHGHGHHGHGNERGTTSFWKT